MTTIHETCVMCGAPVTGGPGDLCLGCWFRRKRDEDEAVALAEQRDQEEARAELIAQMAADDPDAADAAEQAYEATLYRGDDR